MKFDEVLIQIGEFGWYQKRLYFVICIPCISAGIFATLSVFLLGVPDYRCAIPGLENDTYAIQDNNHQILVNRTIPVSSDATKRYDGCFVYPESAPAYDNYSHPFNVSKTKCNKWVYDKSIFQSTLVSDLNLICDKNYIPSIVKMVYFSGMLAGALVFGFLSDIIGRKKTLMLSLILVSAAGIGVSWVNSVILYVVLRFLVAMATIGIFTTGFVIGMEFVGPSKRMWAGIVVEYFFALGLIILAGVGYLLRDWRHINMAVTFPCLIFLSYFWFIPESPRWLMSKGRFEEAEAILRNAARVNKVKLPDKLFDEHTYDYSVPQARVWHLFRTKVMTMRTLVIFANWFVVTMAYYGLSLNTGNLGGNFFLNFTLSGLVEIPAYTLCILLLDKIGRKWLHFCCMVFGGIACISTVFTSLYAGEDLRWLTITLAMVGKLGASGAFAVIYVFSAELYPTVLRNSGMGASSCCARVGGMIAPYIADLNKVVSGDFGMALPLVVFGAASVAAGVLALTLPETLNKELPETIEDAETFGRTRHSKEVFVNGSFSKEGEDIENTSKTL